MGLELMESFPTYLKSIRDMDDILCSVEGGSAWSIEGRRDSQLSCLPPS